MTDVLYIHPEITIVGALGVILIVIGFFCIFKGLLNYSNKSVIIGILLVSIGSLLIGGGVIAAKNAPVIDRSGYIVYLDGEETDPDKIDIRMYRASYDDEKQVVYLSKRSGVKIISTGRGTPIVVTH